MQFYSDEAVLVDEMSRVIGGALGAGNAGIIIATKAHREALVQRLQARGLDLTSAAAQGRYVAVDVEETLAKIVQEDQIDASRFVDIIGALIVHTRSNLSERSHVVIFGEIVTLLWEHGQARLTLKLEHCWNDLAKLHEFSLHCAYPMPLSHQTGESTGIERLAAESSQVLPGESFIALNTDEERLRAIDMLQQKAQSLETELLQHRYTHESLRQRNEELQAAVAGREEFLSAAAHELKTPVTSIRGVAQLLLRKVQQQREIAPDRLEYVLGTIDQQTSRLTRLMERLLDSAQIQAGTLQVVPEQSDLVALVRAVVVQYSGMDQTVAFTSPAELMAAVDPVRLSQVVSNLLDNAFKFSPPNSTVTIDLQQDGAGTIYLVVTDQGVGIAPEVRKAVFRHFQRAPHGSYQSGMGLGLYIAREIVELHGGTVWVEQPEHTGARFVVALPPSVTSVI